MDIVDVHSKRPTSLLPVRRTLIASLKKDFASAVFRHGGRELERKGWSDAGLGEFLSEDRRKNRVCAPISSLAHLVSEHLERILPHPVAAALARSSYRVEARKIEQERVRCPVGHALRLQSIEEPRLHRRQILELPGRRVRGQATSEKTLAVKESGQ